MENYLIKILKLRKNFPKEENDIIKKAYAFSKEKHNGQKFEGENYPYFMHPAYAAFLLAKWERNYEEICAGLLHDVMEDCNISLAAITKIFGQRIAFLVDGMSWERKWNKETKTWLKDRPGFYKKIMDYSLKDVGLVIVHASDEMSKLNDILKRKVTAEKDFEKAKKRLKWIASIMVPFYRELGLRRVSENVRNKLKVYFEILPKSKLNEYISKDDLKKLKKEISEIKGIAELR